MYADARAKAEEQDDGLPPSSLLPARLWFGQWHVLVEMPFKYGRLAHPIELTTAGLVVEQVAAAIVWLARNGLVYCDVRPANVIVAEDGPFPTVYLVDYDDMVLLPEDEHVMSASQLLNVLKADSNLEPQGCFGIGLEDKEVLLSEIDRLLSSP